MVKGQKRWKKGESSSSNPTTKKYRELAKKNKMFSFGLDNKKEKSLLTTKALAELDSQGDTKFMADDNKSIMSDVESADTFRSWASNWSDCTNATFNKVHRYWRSNSALHKEILSVLAAVTEIIKERDGQESEIEYFAALMTGLNSIKDMEESTAAFFYLIALAIKKVPENVLRAKFGDILAGILEPLAKYGEEANNVTLIKSGLMCLCWLLKSQDRKVWQHEQTQNAYMLILSFVDHQKPKIRKCGQEAVRLILSSFNSNDATSFDDISAFTAEYCIDLITNGNKLNSDSSETKDQTPSTSSNFLKTKSNKYTKNKSNVQQTILHTLTLLKHTVHHFGLYTLKKVGECLLRCIKLNDILITSLCFQTFHQLFEARVHNLNADLTAQILNALYDYQPSENDPQQLIAWLAVMESAMKCFNRLSAQQCITHLPSYFHTLMLTMSSSHHKNVHIMITNVLCGVMEQCVGTNIPLFVEDLGKSGDTGKSLLGKIFQHIEAGLSYSFHASWFFVMKILASAFTAFKHRDTFVIIDKCLSSLGTLRESDQFDFKKEADQAIGRAIQNFGPKLVIDCIPLHMTGDETVFDYPRSWMLPLLKDNIEKTELGYFVSTVMPLAKKLREKSVYFKRCNQPIESKVLDNMQAQFWSMLPGFCDHATDLQVAFKSIARSLGEVLEKCPDLRTYIFHALRTLVLRSTEENQVLISNYAKNYLPILFNLYTTEITLEKDPVRQSLLDTIKTYLQITDLQLINTYLLHAVTKFEEYSVLCQQQTKPSKDANNNSISVSDQKQRPKAVQFDFALKCDVAPVEKDENELKNQLNTFARYGFLDLISVLGKYANEKNVHVIYDLAIKGIESKSLDKTVQKKCYKILDCILDSGKSSSKVFKKLNISQESQEAFKQQNESITAFIETKFQSIAMVFITSLAQCNAAAKVPRLKCLVHLMDYVKEPEQKVFLKQIMPEVILCMKEINQKSRDAAFTLITSMLKTWQMLSTKADQTVTELASLHEFFHLVMVGLAGSTNMTSCTCLALSALAYEFRENISGSLIGELIETACILTRSDQKEITMASINLLKMLVTIFNQSTLSQYLKQVCDVIFNLHEKRTSKTNVSDEINSFNNVAPITKSQQIRNLVKTIVKKLIKKFSYEIVHEMVFSNETKRESTKAVGDSMETELEPSTKRSLTSVIRAGLENLFVNLKKQIEQEKQRKADDQKKSNKPAANDDLISMYTTKTSAGATNYNNEVEDLLKESDDDEAEAVDAKTTRTSKTNKSERNIKRSEKKASSGGHKSWIQENDDEDPLDLLDPMAIKNVFATKPLTKTEIAMKKEREETSRLKNRGFSMGSDGRLLIQDSDEDEMPDDMRSRRSSKAKKTDELDDMMDTLSLSRKSMASKKSQKKRGLDGDDSDEDDGMDDRKSSFSYKAGGTGIHRKLKPGEKKPSEYGSEYKAKKAHGDVKRKNQPDPYAYIPLNMTKLNKRKRAKLQGEYKGIVRAVHRGAVKGKKAKKRL